VRSIAKSRAWKHCRISKMPAGGFFIYAVTVAVLLIKPAGFYGRE